ncbi:MAG TPA: hypothetical protein VJ951_05220 [Bacteroidales bacterium]|nr:hypothetical protein [Bacteroidales bacterium]
MKNRISIVFIIFSLVFTISCESYLDTFNKLDNIDTEIELEPSAALPVAYGSFSLQDVLESFDSTGFIRQDDDDLINIYYRDTLLSLDAMEFMDIPDKDFLETYFQSDVEIPAWVNLDINDTLSFKKSEELIFTEGGDRLDSVFLSGGDLRFDIFSEFKHSGFLVISSPNFIDTQGNSYIDTIEISDASGNFEHVELVDLSGFKLEITDDLGYREFRLDFDLSLIKQNAPVSVGEECGITIGFRDLVFSEAFGFLESREVFSEDQSIELDFFSSVTDALNFSFKDPNFNIFVHNSFGIPISIDLTKMQVQSSKDNHFYNLSFKNDTMMPFNIYAPSIDEIGNFVTTARYINSETSNIDFILSQLPNLVDLTVAANTGIEGADGNFFLTDDSEVILETELVLPMWLKTDGYTLQDTLDLDLESVLGDISLLKSAIFNITTINELPLQLDLQAYFLDENGAVLDSLYKGSNPFILAAPVDASGDLIEEELEENAFPVEVTEEQLVNIEGTKFLLISAHAVTSDNGASFVKFYSHSLLDYSLSINADFKINPGEI